MSEELNASGLEPGSAPVPDGAIVDGSSNGSSSVLEGLEGDSLQYAQKNGITSIGEAITKSRELEKLIGNSLRIPGQDASSDDVAAYFDKATKQFMPETAEGFEFAMPEKMPDGMEYNGDFVGRFKEGMLARGVPPQLASKVHDWFMEDVLIPDFENGLNDYQSRVDGSNSLLEKTWGAKDSQEFRAGQEHVLRAIEELGGDGYKQALIEAGVIDDQDNILNASLLIPLAKISEKFLSEDSLVNGNSIEENPFADDTKNWSKMNELIAEVKSGKRDPKQVKALIAAAGKEPGTFGLP